MPRNQSRVYVGNLPPFFKIKDIEDLFDRFGKIVDIYLNRKTRQPFAFVEFDDPQDAREAIREYDGYNYNGYILQMEFSRIKGSRHGEDRNRPRRSRHRLLVSGLPASASWQDLKDHMRKVAGSVCFAEVFADGSGIVEFCSYDDMKCAVKKLDDSKFRSHEAETSYIRVKAEFDYDSSGSDHERGRSRSRSYSPRSRRRSPSYSSSSSSNRSSRNRSRSRSYDRR